jgi:tetratricopeptide (TPR) repeat protein
MIKEQVLGPDHPNMAIRLHDLAVFYGKQGKYEQAEPLYQRALTIFERVLGPDHPDTARNLHDLAALYADQGKYEQAEPLYQRALEICERVLGLEHPNTIRVRDNYTELLQKMKQKT